MIKLTQQVGSMALIVYVNFIQIIKMYASNSGGTNIESTSQEVITVKESFKEVTSKIDNTIG